MYRTVSLACPFAIRFHFFNPMCVSLKGCVITSTIAHGVCPFSYRFLVAQATMGETQFNGSMTVGTPSTNNNNFEETVNGDGSPFPAPVGTKVRGGGLIKKVHPDGTYSIEQPDGSTRTVPPTEVFVL